MSLQDVMLEELRDLYSAENQLLKALPKLAKAAEDEDLKQAFEQATAFAEETERAERRANRYDLSEALLQIAVVLSSITLLTRQKAFFLGGLVLGIAGALFAASALLLH